MRSLYEDYITSVSTWGMAASYDVLELIVDHCQTNNPSRILDLGSGISSSVLSSLKLEGSITSSDDSEDWLKRTVEFMRKHKLNVHEMIFWNDFKNEQREGYDFIFYDLGRIPVRLENMKHVFGLLNEGGYILVDDMHKPKVRELCNSLVKEFEYEVVRESDKEVRSLSGRYGVLIKKP